jgi:hypothetical protein
MPSSEEKGSCWHHPRKGHFRNIILVLPLPLVLIEFRETEVSGLALESLVLFASLVTCAMSFVNPKPSLFEGVCRKVASLTRTSMVALAANLEDFKENVLSKAEL